MSGSSFLFLLIDMSSIPNLLKCNFCTVLQQCAFSALTLLDGHPEEHPACKNRVMVCWCGYLSASRCRLFAYGPADATAFEKKTIISCLVSIQTGFTFLVPAYSGCPGK